MGQAPKASPRLRIILMGMALVASVNPGPHSEVGLHRPLFHLMLVQVNVAQRTWIRLWTLEMVPRRCIYRVPAYPNLPGLGMREPTS